MYNVPINIRRLHFELLKQQKEKEKREIESANKGNKANKTVNIPEHIKRKMGKK